jgi:hypothetical protein
MLSHVGGMQEARSIQWERHLTGFGLPTTLFHMPSPSVQLVSITDAVLVFNGLTYGMISSTSIFVLQRPLRSQFLLDPSAHKGCGIFKVRCSHSHVILKLFAQ